MSFTIRGLKFDYDGPLILTGLTLEHLRSNEIIVLLGRSGSGKTTLLNLLGTLTEKQLDANVVLFSHEEPSIDYAGLTEKTRVQLRRDRFGFVLQSCYLLPYLTCRENVALPLQLRGQSREEALKIAEQTTISTNDPALVGALDRRPHGVSQGQKQRFAVLRAVAQHPAVIFADEPTSNLDPRSTLQMTALLQAWQRGGTPENPRTLIMVCHSLATARAIGDRFVLLHEGKEAAVFTKDAWDAHIPLLTKMLGSAGPEPEVVIESEPLQLSTDTTPLVRDGRPSLSFFARMAYRDLLDIRRLRSGLTVLATVMLVTLMAVIAWAWPTLAEQRRLKTLADKPNSNLMFVSPPYGQLGARISDATRIAFTKDLEQKLGKQLLGVYPTRDISVGVEDNRGTFDTLDPPRGRTVTGPDDPQLRGITWKFGGTLRAANTADIVVCPRFLERLGFSLDAGLPPPRRVTDHWGDPLNIVGIAAENFPQGVTYYMGEAEFAKRELNRLARDRIYDEIDTQLLEDDWKKAALNSTKLDAWKEWAADGTRRVVLSVERDGSGFKLRGSRSGMPRWQWEKFFADLRTAANADGNKLPELKLEEVQADKSAVPPLWTGITVHISDLPAQPLVIAACKAQNLGVNETVSAQLASYREAADGARELLSYVIFFVLFVTAVNLAVIQDLRLGEKRTENALLRAIGMSRSYLSLLYVLQAIGVGVVGVGLGTLIGVSGLLASTSATERRELLASDWAIRVLVTSSALVLILIGTAWYANRRVSSGSPAEQLSGG